MAKRFTDTNKWKKAFIKSLPPEYKLFWLYLLDECDHAGIWNVEFDVIHARLGIQLSETKARGLLKDRVVVFDNGTKWFIPDFIEFQYGKLNIANRAHKSVIEQLEKYNLFNNGEYEIKPLTSPLQGCKDMDKDKEKDKDKEGEINFHNPFGDIERFIKPDQEEVKLFFVQNGKTKDLAVKFFNYYDGLGWMKGNSRIYNWRSFALNWEEKEISVPTGEPATIRPQVKTADQILAERKSRANG